jgi:uncharacterized membrane protein
MNRTYWICAFVLVGAAFAATLAFYPSLPGRVPMHWNIRGEVDGWGSRGSVWIMPCVMLGLLGFFAILPALSPKPFDLGSSRPVYLFVMVLVIGLMGYIHALILWAALRPRLDVSRSLVAGVMLMLALVGNVFGKIKRNLYMGVRTPWTLASERVWSDTHRVAAWWLVGGGLLGFVVCLAGLPVWLALIAMAPAVIWPCVFSYLRYKRLERLGELPDDASAIAEGSRGGA